MLGIRTTIKQSPNTDLKTINEILYHENEINGIYNYVFCTNI